jgi:hypothetical protein
MHTDQLIGGSGGTSEQRIELAEGACAEDVDPFTGAVTPFSACSTMCSPRPSPLP